MGHGDKSSLKYIPKNEADSLQFFLVHHLNGKTKVYSYSSKNYAKWTIQTWGPKLLLGTKEKYI